MKQRSSLYLFRLLIGLLAGLILLTATFLILVSSARSSLGPSNLSFGTVTPLLKDWEYVNQQGRWQPLGKLPQKVQAPAQSLVLRFALPQYHTSGQLLTFRNFFQAVELLDAQGNRLYEYGIVGKPPFGRLLGNQLCIVELPTALSGKQITLRLSNPYNNSFLVPVMAMGTSGAIFMAALTNNRGPLLLAALLLFIGLGFLIVLITLWFSKNNKQRKKWAFLCHSALFCVVCSVWILTDCSLLQFATDNPIVGCLISFFAFMLLPFFFLSAVHALYQKLPICTRTVQLLLLLNLLVQALLQAFGLLDLIQLLPITHVLLVVSIGVAGAILLCSLQTNAAFYRRGVVLALSLLSLSALGALLEFYFLPPIDNGRLFRVGLYGAAVVLATLCLRRILVLVQENRQARLWQRLATTDPLTALGNRAALEQDFARLAKGKDPLVVFMLDLNNLKSANDTWGHPTGDILLRATASCLQQVFGPLGFCYRLGGDEFCVLAQGADIDPVALNRQLSTAIQARNKRLKFPLSIARGWAQSDQQPPQLDPLLAQADRAMYQDKQRNKQAPVC